MTDARQPFPVGDDEAIPGGTGTLRDTLRDLVTTHRRALLALALGYLGAAALGVLATVLVPALRPGGLGALGAGGEAAGVGALVADAYRSGDVLLAAAVTLGVNLLVASALQTTLPTLVVPFLGVVLTLVRGLTWGVLFTPVGAEGTGLAVHAVTLLIEGAAYVVVGLAAWVHGRYVLAPQRYGFAGRRAAWAGGLRATARLYVVVLGLLVVGAVYEAVTVIHVIA